MIWIILLLVASVLPIPLIIFATGPSKPLEPVTQYPETPTKGTT